jgi:hypothetical protein
MSLKINIWLYLYTTYHNNVDFNKRIDINKMTKDDYIKCDNYTLLRNAYFGDEKLNPAVYKNIMR